MSYKEIPCVEIWSRGSLCVTVDQLKHAEETRILHDKKLGQVIAKQLRAVVSDIESYAIQKSKNEDSNVPFEWYFTDVVENVTYLAQLNKKQIAFVGFNTFNNINTDNEFFCTEINMWMDSLIYDSMSFSG